MQKLCVFDLDGTLMDSLRGIADSLNAALLQLGCPPVNDEECASYVGNGARKLCERALPPDRQDLLEEAYALYSDHYFLHCGDCTPLYDGIEAMLAALQQQGILLAVLSNKPERSTLSLCETAFPQDTFAMVLGLGDRFPRKPAPDALLHIIKSLGIAADDTTYIGDSVEDVEVARAAGVCAVAVSWGFRARTLLEDAAPDAIADTVTQLQALLLERTAQQG